MTSCTEEIPRACAVTQMLSLHVFYRKSGKRYLDLLLSVPGIIALSPLLLVVMVLVSVTSVGGAFFMQDRTGRFGRKFHIVKFRTMLGGDSRESALITAANDSRITVVGRWLRKVKIDELPQLVNVIRGDMSLVGPRPEVPKFTSLYTEQQREVLQVRPGITGPAAIAFVDEEQLLAGQLDQDAFYRNQILPAKLALDLAYCRDFSLTGDLKLMFQSVFRVFLRLWPATSPRRVERKIYD
jgi:lipopolysaccharide/colanic/teichoic acid biosynthesis glycosyltransferase